MPLVIASFLFFSVLIIIIIFIICRNRKRQQAFQDSEQTIKDKIDAFNRSIVELSKSFICHTDECKFFSDWRDTIEFLKSSYVPKKNVLSQSVKITIERYNNLHVEVQNLNAQFVIRETARCSELFSNIDGKTLDNQQKCVVVTDENHNLVLAGAGSGKTLTIAGKVKYLVSEKNVDPKDILLIAFTKKSAEEMTERIANRLGIQVEATTFHKLGLDIIKSATNSRPDVLENIDGFITDFFENNLVNNQQVVKALIEFFAYYLHIPADMQQYSTLGEAYEHEKGLDFETIKSKYERNQYAQKEADERKTNKKTLQGETVRSLEEVSIANYLFLNGVKYEYEKLYPYASDDPLRKSYRPDFYLPDYDIYLEHFGINHQGRLPWLSQIEEEKYIEGMQWKRNFHKSHGTKLIETYSYYSSDGILLDKLDEQLKKNGVVYRQPDYNKIFDVIYSKESDKYFSEFKKLCATFITLLKSNGYGIEDLSSLQNKELKESTPFFIQRTALFLSIIRPLLVAYNDFLVANKSIDFSDMIIKATEIVKSGHQLNCYKYVIIDEYQDISVARYKLVKAILDQTNAHLLCVGDDWQSIYRFAGSDISLFTHFESYFGYTATMRIEKTYRNSQQLINEVGRFIMKNPCQLKKSLRSEKSISYPISFWFYKENPFSVLKRMVDKLIADFGSESSILFLGRTVYDSEFLKESNLFDIRTSNGTALYKYKESPLTPISFLTVHKAKGLEADNVIILNFENSTLGFPNKISDDPVLGLVLSDSDTYDYAEERRLLYVAITRTKNRTFILTNDRKPSEFIADFMPSSNVAYIGQETPYSESLSCPRCKTGHLLVRKNEETNTFFVGCSNYPQCDYTLRDTSIMNFKRRCPSCGGFLVKRKGKFGVFWGCTNYPNCNYTEQETNTEKRRIGFR